MCFATYGCCHPCFLLLLAFIILILQRSHGDDGPASPGYHEDAESHHPDDASAAGGLARAASSHHGEYPAARSSHHASSSHHGGAADEHSLPPDATPRSRRSGTHGGTSIAPPVAADGYATPARPDDLFPIPPRASLNQSEYTDQWVEQAATETATGTAIPPPQTPMHGDDWGNDNDDGGNYLDDGMGDENIDGDEMMGEEETIESFEDRVLNKRAAQLHRCVISLLLGIFISFLDLPFLFYISIYSTL